MDPEQDPKGEKMIKCLFGKRGKGKTFYTKNVIRRSVLPCIISDPMNEYQDVAVLGKITDQITFDMFKIRFVPDSDLEFEILCRCVFNSGSNLGLNFIADEIDLFTSKEMVPNSLLKILRYSRHLNINIFAVVRNPSELNLKIRALADSFIIFNAHEPAYLDYFKKFDPSYSERIPRLQIGEYIEHKF